MQQTDFSHRQLDVYRIALRYRARIAAPLRTITRELRTQLERASDSIVLNIAEGAGRSRAGEKRSFYAIARGSAFECSAGIDLLQIRGVLSQQQYEELHALLLRITQMLSRLCR